MLNPEYWKEPADAIRQILSANKNRTVMPGGSRPGTATVPLFSDYREMAKLITRSGRPLTKEEKKKYGIHHSSKASTSVFDFFTPAGYPHCLKEATTLSLAIEAIVSHNKKVNEWKKWGIKEVEFSPAPDSCPKCRSLHKTYPIGSVPTPILDTHLDCRCSIRPAESEVLLSRKEAAQSDQKDSPGASDESHSSDGCLPVIISIVCMIGGYFVFGFAGAAGGGVIGFFIGHFILELAKGEETVKKS